MIVGQLVPFGGSPQQTDTQWSAVTVTAAVLVSVWPLPLSVPGAAPPSFWFTPNQGSAPILKLPLGVATIVAVLPAATCAVITAFVDAMPPLTVTEHHVM